MRLADPSPAAEDDQAPGADAPLAEAILSGGWDTERDLVVLVGADPAAATAALRRLGQQRILWFRTGDGGGEALGGVIRVDHLDEVAAAVRALGALGPERITGRALEPAHARLYDQTVARIERARSERFLGGARDAADTARARLQHGLINLPALCRWSSAAALGGALAGTPMVIVGPGPSLARNIEALAELQGRAVLLALSHSLVPLRRAGITPDFVLAADAHDVSHHLAGEELSGVAAMVVAATAHPSVFHSAAPRLLALMEPGPIDGWLAHLAGDSRAGGPALTPGGGSVAHTALALGLAWGCDPIGFVGVDLSFPGGRCYVDSSADGDVRAVVSPDGRALSLEGWSEPDRRGRALGAERLVELPGWDGRPLPSSFHFSMCQRWFEETSRRLAGKVRLYNCSEGGAYIGGMRHIRLSSLTGRILQSNRHDPIAAAERVLAHIDARAQRRAARERLVELMLELRRFPALSARELDGAEAAMPVLSILVDAELGAAVAGAGAGDAERRRVALNRWAAWLEPRVVEAERALAREDRASETIRIRPLTAAAGKLG